MPYSDIKELRKSGQLMEAFQMAATEYALETNDWTRRSLFWVCADLLQTPKEVYVMAENELLDMMAEIVDTMEERDQHLIDTWAWCIYRYLRTHYTTIGVCATKHWLMRYMELPSTRPSTTHSAILALAVRLSKEWEDDFRLAPFLGLWKLDYLSEADYQSTKTKDGMPVQPLVVRVAHAYSHALLKRPAELTEPAFHAILMGVLDEIGYLPHEHMVAVRLQKTEVQGRPLTFVKLVSPSGHSVLADSHLFHMPHGQILGRVFRVALRQAKSAPSTQQGEQGGKPSLRVQELLLTDLLPADIFPPVLGYVDGYDAAHRFYHIFDSYSRHFVADSPRMQVSVGDYVWFCPIVPSGDKFKSAIPVRTEPREKGRTLFGLYPARVTYVNAEKQYLRFAWAFDVTSPERTTPATPASTSTSPTTPPAITLSPSDPLFAEGGYIAFDRLSPSLLQPDPATPSPAQSSTPPAQSLTTTLSVGSMIRVQAYLKRSKDKLKHPHAIYAE